MTYAEDPEATEADAVPVPESFDIEVPEADALEQAQEVPTDDDYD